LNAAFPGEQNNDMFFTIWYGVYNRPSHSLIYASGGHPPAILFSGVPSQKSKMRMLSTKNNVIGGMSDVAYNKSTQEINSPSCLFIFSDGVYEIQKTDGRMWRFEEFSEFVNKPSTDNQSDIDRIYQHARKLNQYDSFEDDFTIIEVIFNSI
jgi:sigma-B regulation protein RsbU (phosphoserine phosphatase)